MSRPCRHQTQVVRAIRLRWVAGPVGLRQNDADTGESVLPVCSIGPYPLAMPGCLHILERTGVAHWRAGEDEA